MSEGRRPQRHISFAGVHNDDSSSQEEEFDNAYFDDDNVCLSSDDDSHSRGSEETAFNAGARTPATDRRLSRIIPGRLADSTAFCQPQQPQTPSFAPSQKRFSWKQFRSIVIKPQSNRSAHSVPKDEFQVNRFVVLFVSCIVAVLTGPFFFNWAATQKLLLASNAYAHYCRNGEPSILSNAPPLPVLPVFSQGYSAPSPVYTKGGVHLFVPEGTAVIFSLPPDRAETIRHERRRQLRDALEAELSKMAGRNDQLRLKAPRRLLDGNDNGWRWWLTPRQITKPTTGSSFWELLMMSPPLARRLQEVGGCSEQLAAINALMPIGVAAWFICSLLGGAFCDLVGSRCSLILALAMASIGWLFLSLCGHSFPGWRVAFAAIGASIDATFFPLMASVSPLFDKHRGVALACLTAARALANQTPKVHMNFLSNQEVAAAVHAVLIASAATVSYFFFPNGAKVAVNDQNKVLPNNWHDWLFGVMSKEYLSLLPLACLTVLRGSFLANTAADQFGDELMPTFARLAVCSLLLCPMLGTLADYAGTRTVFLLTNSVACVQFFCLSFLSHRKGFLIIAAALHPVVSAFFIGQFYFHIAACHGNENIGLRIGLTVALSGPFGLLVTPMYGYSLSRASFSPMNRLCLILSLFCFPLIFSLSGPGTSPRLVKALPVIPHVHMVTEKTGVEKAAPAEAGSAPVAPAGAATAEGDDIPLTPNVVYR